jgi:CRISPR-associated exonuclease Cas4
MTEWLIVLGLGLLVLGGLLVLWATRARKVRGLGQGISISLDDLTLFSERLKIVGRPDRIVRQDDFLIPEEWKPSARQLHQSHRLQVATYCVLIEENFDRRPPHGVVVLAGGERVAVPFTDELRVEVLSVAEKIREHRRNIKREIPVRQPAAKCRACSQRQNCSQARV